MLSGEVALLQWLEQFRTPFWNVFWETVTLLGEDTVFIFLIAALYFLRDKKLAYRISFLAVTSLGLNGILKNTLQIPRPFAEGEITGIRAETATGYSFPSGHTQNFTTWSVALADTKKQKKWLILAIVLSVGVAFSRLFLGVHYPSDVIAALLLGIGISLLGNRLYDIIENKNRLYLGIFLLLTPFFLWFLSVPNPLFEDFFKCYGMMGGFLISVRIEQKHGQFREDVSFLFRLCRMIVGVAVALFLKALLSACSPNEVHLALLWDSLRYFLLVLIIFGGYPVFLNKCKL
ncbi:MAG: phosphatase PAP2 family protein [Clostridia bacterium]|nr:phosphatase PAP2 family protein [Clostridia bacterium]